MAEKKPVVVARPVGGTPPAPKKADGMSRDEILYKVMQFLMIFLAMQGVQYAMKAYQGSPPAPTTPAVTPLEGAASSPGTTPAIDLTGLPTKALPAWAPGTEMSLLVYLSTSESGVHDWKAETPIVAWPGLTYGNWKDNREEDVMVQVPESVQRNGSLWADVFLVKGGEELGEGMGESVQEVGKVVKMRKQLTRFQPRKKIRKVKKLIKGADDEEEVEEVEENTSDIPIVSYWAPNLTLTVVADTKLLNPRAQPEPVRPFVQVENTTISADGESGFYYPIIFPNDFWLLKENQVPINTSTPVLPLQISYYPLTMFKFTAYAAMADSFEQQAKNPGPMGGSGADMDEFKKILTQSNPYLLVITILVTMLHTLFEFLAFSSDVQHWRKKDKSLVGVSLRTILTNVVVQFVIMLYLHDSSAETSFMVLAGQGMGLVIEIWKIQKVISINLTPSAPGALIPYSITFSDKHVLTKEEALSREYDKQAFKLVGWGALPFMIGYTIYSMLYETHKGWYSFVVTTLAQFIYMFGFAQLIPQLLINYKLKSVAHMPMRAMVYKTLGTFVDDLFAFVIKMPWLHRIACFRDDVVFFILLYQRWIYREDKTRENEFGQLGVSSQEELDALRAAAAAGEEAVVESKKDK